MRKKALIISGTLILALAMTVIPFPQTLNAQGADANVLQNNTSETNDVGQPKLIPSTLSISPRSAMRIEMETSVDNQAEIDGCEEIEVKVTWLESLAMQEPVQIAVSKDAQILVKDINDIVFETNGIQKDISDLTMKEGVIKFMTGKAEGRSICTLTYKVKAPLAAGEFKISTKVAAENAVNMRSNYIEKTFNVTSGLTVETTYDIICGNTSFDVFGLVNYKKQEENLDLVISLDVYNEETGEMVYEITGADYPVDNTYKMGSFVFPDDCEDGIYVVYVTLADGWDIIGSASKKITYIKYPLTVETSHDTINGNTPFDVSGLVKYKSAGENPDLVVSLDVYNKETKEMVYELTGVDFPLDNTYRIGSLVFPDYCEDGVYVVYVTLADDMNIIGSAIKEVTYIK